MYLFLITLLAAAVSAGIFFLYSRRAAAEPTVPIEYTICLAARSRVFPEENGSWEELLGVGTPVSNANATAEMGEVIALEVRPHTVMTVQAGRVVSAEDPMLCELYITVRADAVEKTGNGLRVKDIRIAAGMRGDYYIGPFFAADALTVSVRCEEKQ